ncbi:MAG: peptidoglycan editing factor PgeF [Anaerolineales bacterium]
MVRTQTGSLVYYQFKSLLQPNLVHGVFTRHGGLSPDPWRSLNIGGTMGDDPDRVAENHQRLFSALNRPAGSVFDVWQVHSANVVVADGPRNDRPHIKGDIILTDDPGVTLLMRFADCVPILLYDPHRIAIGIAHAGWLGTVRRAAEVAVQAMVQTFQSDPTDILVGLGPSIGPDHYTVGAEVVEQFEASFGSDASRHLVRKDEGTYLDLWSANQALLQGQGVEHIEVAKICTACHIKDWYSHRSEGGKTGRFGVAIALSE